MADSGMPFRILVVDDEPAVRQSYAYFLEDRDYSVSLAANGEEGLRLLEEEQPDLLLLDLQMPGIDGLEVLARMKELGSTIPRIVVSGTGEIADVVQALRLGAWDYILKPVVDLSVLEHAVKKGLERAVLLRENRQYQEHLEELVDQRTAELESANTHLKKINSRLQQVAGTMRDLSVYTDINRFGRSLLEKFAMHMLARGGSLYIREEEGLRLLHSLDSPHATSFIPFPLREGSVFQYILENKDSLIISDISDTDFLNSSGWNGYSNGSFIGFPLQDSKEGIAGIVTLHSCINATFIEEDREIGRILASNSCATLRAIHAFELLKESEARFRSFFEHSRVGMFIMDNRMRIIAVNSTLSAFTGLDSLESRGSDIRSLFPEIGEMIAEPAEKVISTGEPFANYEGIYTSRNGRKINWLANLFPLQVIEGKAELIAGVIIDITERKQAEDEVSAALEEKDVLLRELYHRTKNNMQIMASLIDIQESFVRDDACKPLFNDIRNRIRTMALVHGKLYQSNDLSTLSLDEYLRDLVQMIQSTYASGNRKVSFHFELDTIRSLIDVTVPCGLIVNELVSNIFKHAFPEKRQGAVEFILKDEGETLLLTIADNGVGFPQGYSPEEATSMGLQTVYLLAVQQLNGEVFWESNEGVRFSIRLRNDLYNIRI